MRMVWILAAGLCLTCSAVGQALGASSAEERLLSNQDVISLARAGLGGDDVVVAKIRQATKETLDVSTDKLVVLKRAGLSKAVIEAMVKRVSQRTVATPTPAPPPPPTAISVRETRSGASAAGSDPNATKAAPSNGRPCVASFKSEGGFWKGEIFGNFREFTGVDKGNAFHRAVQAVASLPNMAMTTTRITQSAEIDWDISSAARRWRPFNIDSLGGDYALVD